MTEREEQLLKALKHISSHFDMEHKVIDWCDSAVAQVHEAMDACGARNDHG